MLLHFAQLQQDRRNWLLTEWGLSRFCEHTADRDDVSSEASLRAVFGAFATAADGYTPFWPSTPETDQRARIGEHRQTLMANCSLLYTRRVNYFSLSVNSDMQITAKHLYMTSPHSISVRLLTMTEQNTFLKEMANHRSQCALLVTSAPAIACVGESAPKLWILKENNSRPDNKKK